jgi:hypothetical protein
MNRSSDDSEASMSGSESEEEERDTLPASEVAARKRRADTMHDAALSTR